MRKKKTLKKDLVKKVNVQQDIKAIPNTSDRSNIMSAVESNIIEQSSKQVSNNLPQTSSNTEMNNTAITASENVQHTEKNKDVIFPKGIHINFYIITIYTIISPS